MEMEFALKVETSLILDDSLERKLETLGILRQSDGKLMPVDSSRQLWKETTEACLRSRSSRKGRVTLRNFIQEVNSRANQYPQLVKLLASTNANSKVAPRLLDEFFGIWKDKGYDLHKSRDEQWPESKSKK